MSAIRRLSLIVASLLLATLSVNASGPKRELRGVWLATVWGIDWPSRAGATPAVAARQQKELGEILDRCAAMNLTSVFFQVRSMGDVMFESCLEPWSSFVSGKRGQSPGWDPLEFAVRECHARGLECYAWVNPFRWSSGTSYDTPSDREWRRRGWLLSHGKYTVFNPGLEEVRAHVTDICREIVEGYDVDGLVFDDYFYPNRIPETEDAPDYQLYRKEAPWMSFGDWRRANVHKAIADVSAMVRDSRPGVRFGISPAGVAGKDDTSARKWGAEPCGVGAADWQYREIYSDPVGLLYQGTVDFISPQLYWSTSHPTAPFGPLSEWWSETANLYDRHFYASVTLERLDKGNVTENCRDLLRQVETNRGVSLDGNMGFVIYSAKFLPRVEDWLSAGPFESPSLPPAVRGAQPLVAEGPEGVKLRDGRLTWRTVRPVAGHTVRYTVYEVPRDEMKRAMADDGDGLCGDYLLGVTYEPEFEVDGGKDCRYAVCVLDGNSVESAPAWSD